MKPIINYIRSYFDETNKTILGIVTLLAGLLIFLNYNYKADDAIDAQYSRTRIFMLRYFVFLFAVRFFFIFIINYF